MGFINNIKNAFYMMTGRRTTDGDRKLLEWLGIDAENTPRRALSQCTYFVCLKTLSEAMGKLPLKLYQKTDRGAVKPPMTNTWRLLSLQPNPYQTAIMFWTLCEQWCQHYGNAYVWIDGEIKKTRKYGEEYIIKGFYPMHPTDVQIWYDDAGLFGTEDCLYYEYTNPETGESRFFRDSEVLHFKNWLLSKDGITALSVREVLGEMISGTEASDELLNNLYKNGMMAKMVVQYSGNLNDPLTKEVQERFLSQLQGPKAAGKVIPIPTQFQLIPLSQSLVDSEFSVLRKYSALQIASAFGVKPSQINDYEHSKYASSEAEALAFLSNTLAFRIRMYEDEINCKVLTANEYKAGYYYKFNERALLRVDSKTQTEMLEKQANSGLITRNEGRENLDLPYMDGADQLLVNGAYIPIDKAGTNYEKNTSSGGEK